MTKPAERLEKILARVAKEQGLDQERLRRWVSFLALCGVLERAIHKGILGTYYLKGGVAMELRFAGAARATKDMDLGLDGNRLERLKVFEQALTLGFDVFGFRLKSQSRSMDLADTIRVEVAVQHRTRACLPTRVRGVCTLCYSVRLTLLEGCKTAGQGLGTSARRRNHRPGDTQVAGPAIPEPTRGTND